MSTTAREQLSLATPQKVADLQWRPVDPHNPSGARMAALWGDPLSGPYGALLRMPAGFELPMHRHSSDERVIVIDGASIHWAEGHDRRAAQIMRSGDYLLIPAGVNHVSAATAGEECLELITQDGKFDFTLATPHSDLDVMKIISFGKTRSLALRVDAEDSAGSPR
jgi:quercetin dioxygenase-like cupin family protein